jgi:hypothetical protein
MYILCFFTSVHTLSLSQGKNTGPLLIEAARNGRVLTVQYFLEQVLMFLTKPVLTELARTECIFPSSQSPEHHTISPHLTSHHTSLVLNSFLIYCNRGPTLTQACPKGRLP